MNKKKDSVLTPGDRQLLELIEQRFERAEQIIGPEPGIYFEFDLVPELHTLPAIHNRSEVFNNLSAGKTNKVKK